MWRELQVSKKHSIWLMRCATHTIQLPRPSESFQKKIYWVLAFRPAQPLQRWRASDKAPKRPRDLNEWAKRMVDIATGETSDREPTPEEQGKDPAAVARGKLGGAIGGKARAAGLTPEQSSPADVAAFSIAAHGSKRLRKRFDMIP
jgi:hypothetical protein